MHSNTVTRLAVLGICGVLAMGCGAAYGEDSEKTEAWQSLFNGKDLAGWTPKILGHELGQNFGDTFRVEDGVIKVAYDKYSGFKQQFGHLFYAKPYGDYRFRLEYRFTGEQIEDGPSWAFRNSGIMIHCQPPETMTKNQSFPVSIEVQLLGGDGEDERSTGNLCTPSTHVVMKGKLERRHCTDSSSKTYHGDQWVKAEVEVRDGTIRHFINGEKVLEYEQPQLDPGDGDARRLIDAGQDLPLTQGYISLQSESHPVEFRNIEILPLP